MLYPLNLPMRALSLYPASSSSSASLNSSSPPDEDDDEDEDGLYLFKPLVLLPCEPPLDLVLELELVSSGGGAPYKAKESISWLACV